MERESVGRGPCVTPTRSSWDTHSSPVLQDPRTEGSYLGSLPILLATATLTHLGLTLHPRCPHGIRHLPPLCDPVWSLQPFQPPLQGCESPVPPRAALPGQHRSPPAAEGPVPGAGAGRAALTSPLRNLLAAPGGLCNLRPPPAAPAPAPRAALSPRRAGPAASPAPRTARGAPEGGTARGDGTPTAERTDAAGTLPEGLGVPAGRAGEGLRGGGQDWRSWRGSPSFPLSEEEPLGARPPEQ